MKLIVVHGDDILKSYERLQTFIKSAKSRGWSVKRIKEPSQNIPDALVQDLLFEKEKLVVVENANLINKSTATWLKKKSDDITGTMIICHPNVLTKTFIKSLPNVDKVEEYKLPKLIWSLLDSFYPGNSKMILKLLHEVIEHEPIEFVFSLLARQLRDVYWIKVDPSTAPYPSWRIGRLKRQASKFTKQQLKNLISDLAEIDVKSKTSQENLLDLLDFVIITKLE